MTDKAFCNIVPKGVSPPGKRLGVTIIFMIQLTGERFMPSGARLFMSKGVGRVGCSCFDYHQGCRCQPREVNRGK